MTTVTMTLLDSQETALILRLTLGPARHWTDFLKDCTRGETDYHGLTLMPTLYTRRRCRRPAYAPRDVSAFVEAAIKVEPPPSRPGTIRPITVEIDAEVLALPLKLRVGQLKTDGEAASPRRGRKAVTCRRDTAAPITDITANHHARAHAPGTHRDRHTCGHVGRSPAPRIHRVLDENERPAVAVRADV